MWTCKRNRTEKSARSCVFGRGVLVLEGVESPGCSLVHVSSESEKLGSFTLKRKGVRAC